jgi:hypothetical protein
MTRMLYTAFTMKNTLNVPDQLWIGTKEYSWWTDLKVNGWLFAATLISAASDFLFPRQIEHWHVALRTTIALAPFLAILLWAQSLARWIRGMDELHQRITRGAVLFAVSATFFFVMLWHRLDKAGFFEALVPTSKTASASWDIGTVGHVFLLLTFLYALGHSIFNRRYE